MRASPDPADMAFVVGGLNIPVAVLQASRQGGRGGMCFFFSVSGRLTGMFFLGGAVLGLVWFGSFISGWGSLSGGVHC